MDAFAVGATSPVVAQPLSTRIGDAVSHALAAPAPERPLPAITAAPQLGGPSEEASIPKGTAALVPPFVLLATWLGRRRSRSGGCISLVRRASPRFAPGGGDGPSDLPPLPGMPAGSGLAKRPRWAPGGAGSTDIQVRGEGGIIATEALEEEACEREYFDGRGRLYRVTWDLGIGIRSTDSVFGERTGDDLKKGEVFEARQIVRRGGRCYFELADGRGWAFDWVKEDGKKIMLCELAAQLYAVNFPWGVHGITWGSDPTMRFCKVYDFPTSEQRRELAESGIRQNDILVMIDKEPVIGLPFGQTLERIWATSGRQPGSGVYYKVTTESPYGIGIRVEPDANGPRTGEDIRRGGIFEVNEIIPVDGGPTYLHLADGRGWVFDTAPLEPDSPSVKRLSPDDAGATLTFWRGSVEDLGKMLGLKLTTGGADDKPHTITVYEDGMAPVKIKASDGSNLRQNLIDNGFQVYADMRSLFHCSAQQLCGTCVVHILQGNESLTPVSVGEKAVMQKNPRNYRLCCNADVYGDMAVKVRPAGVYYGGGTS